MAHIALSYSRLSCFEKCPMQFAAKYIAKNYPDEGENFFFVKGQRKHDQLEHYILKKLNPLMVDTMQYDSDVQGLFPFIDHVIAQMPTFAAEQQMAVDTNWQPCDWFSKKTMFRAIVDFKAIANAVMLVVDWKSGKVREYDDSDTGQLHLTAAMMFATHPEVQSITTAYAFVEHTEDKGDGIQRNIILPTDFTRDQDLRSAFDEAFDKVNSEKEWAPQVNEYCKYCLITRDRCPNSSKNA